MQRALALLLLVGAGLVARADDLGRGGNYAPRHDHAEAPVDLGLAEELAMPAGGPPPPVADMATALPWTSPPTAMDVDALFATFSGDVNSVATWLMSGIGVMEAGH